MTKRWNRTETWLGLGVLAVAVLLTVLAALPFYMAATATPLHPTPDLVPSSRPASATTRWTPAIERGRQILRSGASEHNLPGLSVAVAVGDDLVWAEGFGWADVERRVPVTPATRFRIGTASMALTSAAVGVLLERGRLRLDDELQAYVPQFPTKPWPTTVRQAMGHVAGVGTDGGDEGPLLSQHCGRPVEALPAFADRSLLFAPGTAYRFSSYGWILVSAALEAAAGAPFLTVMREQVFAPLGMDDTRGDDAGPLPDRAVSYFPRFAADPRYGVDAMREVDHSCYAGAGVFLSTPRDLVRFAVALDAGRLLQPATVQLLRTALRLPSGQDTGYGLGWDLDIVTLAGAPVRVVGHDGDLLGGPVASLWSVPERRLIVAVTSNISYADTAGLALRVAEAFAVSPATSRTVPPAS